MAGSEDVLVLDLPDLDRRCILDDLLEGESLAAGAAFFSVDEAIVDGTWESVSLYSSGSTHKGNDKTDIRDDKDRTTPADRAAGYNYEGMVAKTGQQCSHV